ncbi:juvenile hormone esterase-like [Sitodiplosis mosellana]|uniref:juvenile hormone esterase-like n=1 Tax=Sitodiplosis mosellana TaxID=263140 RepID=UPI00244449A2|nr:juvenile hormone esterase-like [Sitodiplosis mosellana]XP_055295978.1 juvenile hormone esterase-like [Sitodiplosis mosellana]
MLIKVILLLVCVHVLFGSINLEKYLWKTWKNNTFYAFRGIRYAEPPTGSLRFKAPQPIKTWNNIPALFEQIRNEDACDCPSPNTSYDEDCLFLNVYTEHLNGSKPVVVFIHPGGFYIGSGSSANYGPEYLLEEDLVLVTFNYRLAFFGFTSVGTNDAIGNAGYKDQALLLKWVYDHIRHFGGDPNCVTLMGDSAGGMSVQAHLVSPLSSHLFHRAFVMSGGILPQAKSPSSQMHLVEKLARLLGCSENENTFDCIKKANTVSITDSLRKIFEFGWDNPVYPWLPIVEPPSDEQPFLNEDPMKLFETGKFSKIPVMVSLTKHETSMSAMYLFEHRDLLTQWVNDFARIGPICMQYEPNDTVSDRLKERYAPYDVDDKEHFIDLFDSCAESFSDSTITFPLHRMVQLVKDATDVYYMKFDFHGSYSGFMCNSTNDKDLCDEIAKKNIVEHCDDLQYLFTAANIPRIKDESSAEGQIVTKYTKLLYSFAKNGYPYFGPDLLANTAKFDADEKYVSFDTKFEVKNNPFRNAALWDSLYPIANNEK